MANLPTSGLGEQNLPSFGFGGAGPARRRRMAFALATGVRRNLGYLLILIVGALT